jgi:hypothetical protein
LRLRGPISKEIAKGLKELQARISASNIPSSKLDETVNIATWNIREFGKKRRSEGAIHYIAEILGQFDVISIIELRDNLTDLGRVLKILGPYWRAVYSDAIVDPGGNREPRRSRAWRQKQVLQGQRRRRNIFLLSHGGEARI